MTAINLVFFKKNGERQDIDLSSPVTVFGRRSECDIRIPVAYVSRKHCRLVRQEENLVIQDLGSANGTYVNGQRVMEANIAPGDQIQVGPMVFVVQIDGRPAEVAQPELVKSAVGADAVSDATNELSESAINEMVDLSENMEIPQNDDDEPLADFDLDDSGPTA